MEIYSFKAFSELNKRRFSKLIKDGFKKGRKTKALVQGYFKKTKPKYILICENAEGYIGAAVVIKEKNFDYLDKFVVAERYHGLGIGNEIWAKIKRKSRAFCFRAAPNNPIGRWYFKNTTGHQKEKEFTVFWVRIKKSVIPDAIEYCINKKSTLKVVKVKS